MSTLRVYKSTFPYINFVLPNGKQLIFQNGHFYTDQENEIAILDQEIKLGHPHIFVDPQNMEVDSEDIKPGAAAKKNVLAQLTREELIAQLQKLESEAVDPKNDLGESQQKSVNPTTTVSIAQAAAGGSGSQIAARLAQLTGK